MAQYVQLQSGLVITEAQYAENLGTKPDLSEIATASQGRDITRNWIPEHLIMSTGDSVLESRGQGDYLIYEELAGMTRLKPAAISAN